MPYIGHYDHVLSNAFRNPEGMDEGTQIFQFAFNFSDTAQHAKNIVDNKAQELRLHVTTDVKDKSLYVVIDAKDYNRLLDAVNPDLLKLLKRRSDYLEHLLNVCSYKSDHHNQDRQELE